jgi:hypothetical protein
LWFDRGGDDETAIPAALDDCDDDDDERTAAILVILIIRFLIIIMERPKPGSAAGFLLGWIGRACRRLGFWIHPTQTCSKIFGRD